MKSENFARLDELLKSKAYTDLTEGERGWVEEALGKQAYEELFELVSGVSVEKTRNTSSQIKSDLIREMKKKHRGIMAGWLTYRTPMYANVLTLLFLAVAIWTLRPSKEIIVEKPITVTVPVVDTVMVQLPSDTVFIERKVKVEVPVYLTRTEPPKEEPKELKGKSFGEEQALQELLVSGR